MGIDVNVEAFTVAGGNGSKTFNHWTFTTVDWPPYVGNTLGSGSWADAVSDAGADYTAGIADEIVGESNSTDYGYL